MPEISVIVPVYKVEPYIRRCVDSILSQTFTDFELILVDDGSPDNSGVICDEFTEKDSRVRVIHKENGGVSSARNAGIDAARGNWITFVDSDDYVTEQYLEDLYEPEFDMTVVGHQHIVDYRDTSESKQLNLSKTDFLDMRSFSEIIEHSGKYWLMFCWGKLYRKQLMLENKICFDKSLTIGEDYVFVITYLSFVTSLKMTEHLSYIHMDYGTGTLSKTFNISFFESMLLSEKKVKEMLIDKLGDHNISKTEDEIINIFTGSICPIINDHHMSFTEKYKTLQYIFKSKYFLKGISDMDKYFAGTSPKYRVLLKTKIPLLVLCSLTFFTGKR